ncbi:MAG: hypothetical protein CSB33_00275 [Desulfobacterales bacterium]|nr:MAG: hypothetical protein CSB33_00275 [Desulfobacterales bacterium]
MQQYFYIFKNRNFRVILLGDILLLVLAYYLSHLIRFDGNIPPAMLSIFSFTVIGIIPVKIITISYFGLYRGMWRYTSIYDMINLIKACAVSSSIIVSIILILFRFNGFSRGIFCIDFILTLLFLGGYRISVRLFYTQSGEKNILYKAARKGVKKILIIGAGSMGEKLVRGIMEDPRAHYDIIGFIDDNPSKLDQRIHGIPVIGLVDDLPEIVGACHIDEIVIAISSASANEIRHIISCCKAADVPFKTIPDICELIEGRVTLSAIREIKYEDLLGRTPVSLDIKQICAYLANRKVMVTGGAGSIGSELCRQVAKFNPSELILVEKNESGLYDMQLQLQANFPNLHINAILASIQNNELMGRIFDQCRPHVVFHAAAYKHVPMMELHPWEAVFNNIIGTRNMLALSHQYQVERFVLVSTDKAVRPTNIMGASKRIAELLTQAYSRKNQTRYMAVRFGNVVGSVGSVAPLFRRQIERGGPLTVTHPEVTRYFMTIPEACSLILQAGGIGKGGEIFVLKMGVPVKIADMAKDMIRLCGFEPGVDIEIEYTGLRPGEKLYEELITEGEDILKTDHEDIMVLNTRNHKALEEINRQVAVLVERAAAGNIAGIKEQFKCITPEYHPQW